MGRHFTLDEARELLPDVRRSIREAVTGRQRHAEAESLLQALLQRILMQGGISVDTVAVTGWKTQRENALQSLKTSMDRLEESGVLVKDLDVGLVDFPTLYRGEEVYLCWRMDEDDIEFWHGVSEGFAGRKEIDRGFLDGHRGD